MKRLSKVSKADWEFVPINPDPNFDPVKNQRVIDESIRKNDLLRKKLMDEHNAAIKERIEAATMYLKNIERGGGESDVEKYFGKSQLAYLRGERIVAELRKNSTFGRVTKRTTNI